jgi:hypothetical protein
MPEASLHPHLNLPPSRGKKFSASEAFERTLTALNALLFPSNFSTTHPYENHKMLHGTGQ